MKKLTLLQIGRYAGALLLVLIYVAAFPQRKKSSILQYDTTPYEGKVVLTDGSEIEGKMVFNDNDGIVTVLVGDESRSFTSRSMATFEYFDEGADRLRQFYCLEFPDPDTGRSDIEICEILKALDSFVVLSKIDRIKTEARKGVLDPKTSPLLVTRDKRKFTQTETVYFLNAAGEFQPYLRILEKEFDWALIDYNEQNNRFLDAELFKEHTGSDYPALQEFAKEHKLSFKRKSDLARILDEYERILSAR